MQRTIVLALLVALIAPERAHADDEPTLLDVEAALAVPTSAPALSPYVPGGTVSIAALFSVTKWLMPVLRARGTLFGAHGQDTNPSGELGAIGSISAGLRFRPRGIAHPEETPRATCIWAEIDAGLAFFGDHPQPTFEAAIGFAAQAGAVDIGPVVRFVHLFPTSVGDDAHAYAVTIGLEVLAFDAR